MVMNLPVATALLLGVHNRSAACHLPISTCMPTALARSAACRLPTSTCTLTTLGQSAVCRLSISTCTLTAKFPCVCAGHAHFTPFSAARHLGLLPSSAAQDRHEREQPLGLPTQPCRGCEGAAHAPNAALAGARAGTAGERASAPGPSPTSIRVGTEAPEHQGTHSLEAELQLLQVSRGSRGAQAGAQRTGDRVAWGTEERRRVRPAHPPPSLC